MSEKGKWVKMNFYQFGRIVCNICLSAYFNLEVSGLENLPSEGGFVLCCNHQSYLDPPLMGLKIKDRQLTFMAKEALFHKPILAPIIKKLGAFPVSKNQKDGRAVKQAIQTVKDGKILALFPEGTRSKSGKLLKPKSGVVVIAAKTGAPIVPTAIKYYGKHPRSRIVVRFGEPISNEQLELGENPTPKMIKSATQIVWGRLSEIYEHE